MEKPDKTIDDYLWILWKFKGKQLAPAIEKYRRRCKYYDDYNYDDLLSDCFLAFVTAYRLFKGEKEPYDKKDEKPNRRSIRGKPVINTDIETYINNALDAAVHYFFVRLVDQRANSNTEELRDDMIVQNKKYRESHCKIVTEEKITDEMIEALVMKDGYGRTYKEIAEIMGISIDKAKKLVSRGRTRVAKSIVIDFA